MKIIRIWASFIYLFIQNIGVTEAVFSDGGTVSIVSEALITGIIMEKMHGRWVLMRLVGKESKQEVEELDFLMSSEI